MRNKSVKNFKSAMIMRVWYFKDKNSYIFTAAENSTKG